MFVIKFSFIVFLLHLQTGSCFFNNSQSVSNQLNAEYGNSTVNKFLIECLKNPTVPCIRKHGIRLLNKLIDMEELKFSDRIFLKKKNFDKNVSSSQNQQQFQGEAYNYLTQLSFINR